MFLQSTNNLRKANLGFENKLLQLTWPSFIIVIKRHEFFSHSVVKETSVINWEMSYPGSHGTIMFFIFFWFKGIAAFNSLINRQFFTLNVRQHFFNLKISKTILKLGQSRIVPSHPLPWQSMHSHILKKSWTSSLILKLIYWLYPRIPLPISDRVTFDYFLNL